jgi:hypothetical protein
MPAHGLLFGPISIDDGFVPDSLLIACSLRLSVSRSIRRSRPYRIPVPPVTAARKQPQVLKNGGQSESELLRPCFQAPLLAQEKCENFTNIFLWAARRHGGLKPVRIADRNRHLARPQ